VHRALLRTYEDVPRGEENFAFANLVFGLRWLHQVNPDRPGFGQFREQRKTSYANLKMEVARELDTATKAGRGS
jgi:hypothetical protein